MKEIGRRGMVGLAALAWPLTRSRAAQAAGPTKVVYGDTSPVASSWPMMVAHDQHFFEAQGLAVETNYTGNNVYVVQQMVGRSLDVGATTFDTALRGIISGAPIAIIGSQMLTYPYGILAASSVKDLKDLAGKRIILPFPSSPLNTMLDPVLRQVGVAPADVEKIYDGSSPNRLKALLSGTVAAAALTQPLDMVATGQGFHRIFDYADSTRSMGFTAYVARRDWLAANADTARKFLAGAAKGVDFLYDPANRAVNIATLVQSAKIDAPTAEKVYDYYVNELKPFSPTLAVSDAMIQGGLAQLGDVAAAARSKPVATFTDLRFLSA